MEQRHEATGTPGTEVAVQHLREQAQSQLGTRHHGLTAMVSTHLVEMPIHQAVQLLTQTCGTIRRTLETPEGFLGLNADASPVDGGTSLTIEVVFSDLELLLASQADVLPLLAQSELPQPTSVLFKPKAEFITAANWHARKRFDF